MNTPRIVPRSEWLAARSRLLEQEKELTRRCDRLAAARRENMTATPETCDETRDVVALAEPSLQSVSPAAVLIPEAEVLLSTAAAVRAESTTTRWWTDVARVIAAALRRMVLMSLADSRQVRRYVPEPYNYLERALMSREMFRL